MPNTDNSAATKPLRLWPGVTAAVLLVLFRSILPAVAPNVEVFGLDAAAIATFGGLLFSVLILAWWFFFSRAPWSDRWISLAVIAVAVVVTRPLTHISIQNGFMNLMFYFSVPLTVGLALVIWAVASRRLSTGGRRVAMVAAIFAGCGIWALARTDGVFGGASVLHWRWTPTAEQILLAQGEEAPKPLPPVPAVPDTAAVPVPTAVAGTATPTASAIGPAPAAVPTPAATGTAVGAATGEPGTKGTGLAMSEFGTNAAERVEWPAFRGPNRDGVARGLPIDTNWTA
jgi:hypothetical protein